MTPSPFTGVVRVTSSFGKPQQSADMIDDSSFREMSSEEKNAKFGLKKWSKEPLKLRKFNIAHLSEDQQRIFPKFKVSVLEKKLQLTNNLSRT